MTKTVNSFMAWTLIVLAAIIGAWFVYQAGLGYYADKTALYTSVGNAYWAERNLIVSQRTHSNIDGAAHIQIR